MKERDDVAQYEPQNFAQGIAGGHCRRRDCVALARRGRFAEDKATKPAAANVTAAPGNALPMGQIGKLKVSRMLLGGNLLTHYTHSRDLQYVYNLAAHYNTDEKIMETLAVAEQHGINALSMHNPPHPMSVLKKYRKQGGKIQWIICPTAWVEDHMEAYTVQVKELLDAGCEAIYLWGVAADQLVSQHRIDLVAKAVEVAKKLGVPSGVGCHDLRVVAECEKHKVPADFYIKTFHHHEYPTAPRPEQLKGPTSEAPGYWCKDPQGTMDLMKTVEKPWFAFKVMAAGAIPPRNGLKLCVQQRRRPHLGGDVRLRDCRGRGDCQGRHRRCRDVRPAVEKLTKREVRP